MKKQFCWIVAYMVITGMCFAQHSNFQNGSRAEYISSKGYWVIESNIKTPESNTIYFYNNDNVLVYKERVEGIRININRRKTLLKLKNALEQAMTAWENGGAGPGNSMLVMSAFKKRSLQAFKK